MDADGLPIVDSGVNYEKVVPIHQKRTLAFLNHFLIRTTSFLNNFAVVCDEKLEDMLLRIERLETAMCILETKLSSIPGLEEAAVSATKEPPAPSKTPVVTSPSKETTAQTNETQAELPPPVVEPQKPLVTISQDPRYTKYFKMVNVGIPVAAVKQKMATEGVDPSILDNPSAASDNVHVEVDDQRRSSESSEYSD